MGLSVESEEKGHDFHVSSSCFELCVRRVRYFQPDMRCISTKSKPAHKHQNTCKGSLPTKHFIHVYTQPQYFRHMYMQSHAAHLSQVYSSTFQSPSFQTCASATCSGTATNDPSTPVDPVNRSAASILLPAEDDLGRLLGVLLLLEDDVVDCHVASSSTRRMPIIHATRPRGTHRPTKP